MAQQHSRNNGRFSPDKSQLTMLGINNLSNMDHTEI